MVEPVEEGEEIDVPWEPWWISAAASLLQLLFGLVLTKNTLFSRLVEVGLGFVDDSSPSL